MIRRVKAVTVRDGELLVEEHPDPEPGLGEVLIKVHGAGLNGADMMQRRGLYPAPPGSPQDIPGLELAGEVVALGPGVRRFQEGERVMPVPEPLSWAEAGGVPEVFTTAHDAVFTQAGLTPGEHLLVHGGAGGVGTAAIQLARATGARVTATVRNEAHRDAVAELGADVIPPEGFEEHGPFDVILELVGAPNLAENVKSLATLGRLMVIGISAGAKAELNLGALMGTRGRILASTLRSRPLEEKALAARAMEKSVLPLLASGDVKVPVHSTFPLDRAADAYDAFAAGGKLGKIVLECAA